MGKWKLVSVANKKRSSVWDKEEELATENWELFDMEADRTEINNLTRLNPELVDKMAAMWIDWAKRTGTIPRPH